MSTAEPVSVTVKAQLPDQAQLKEVLNYDPDENDWLDAQNVIVHPTHWQPLPAPPALRAISGDTSNG